MNRIVLYLDDMLDDRITSELNELNKNSNIGWEFHSHQIKTYEELLTKIEEEKPSLLLLDNKLNFDNDNNGEKLIYYIKEFYSKMLTILISGQEIEESFFYNSYEKENITYTFVNKLIMEYEMKEQTIVTIGNDAGKYKIYHENLFENERKFHSILSDEVELNSDETKKNIVEFLEHARKVLGE